MNNEGYVDLIFHAFLAAGGFIIVCSSFWKKEKGEEEELIKTRKRQLWEENQSNKNNVMGDVNESSPTSSVNTNSTTPTHAESSIDLSVPDTPTLEYLCKNDDICSNAQETLHLCMDNIAFFETGYTVLLHLGGAFYIYSHMMYNQSEASRKKFIKDVEQSNINLKESINEVHSTAEQFLNSTQQGVMDVAHNAHIKSLQQFYGSQDLEQKLKEANSSTNNTKYLGLDYVLKRVDSFMQQVKQNFYQNQKPE